MFLQSERFDNWNGFIKNFIKTLMKLIDLQSYQNDVARFIVITKYERQQK